MKFETQQGYIYFVTDGEAVKIGFAINPAKRIQDLQISNHRELKSLGTISAPKYQERLLHSRFKEHHIRGEWFRIHEDITNFLADLESDGYLVHQREHIENLREQKFEKHSVNIMTDG